MARRRKPEEHQNHEAWAIPYGDLITLLLAFFVVMYAISSVNDGKYRVLSYALNAAFRGTPTTPQPVAVGTPAESISEQLPDSEVKRIFSSGLPIDTRAMPQPRAAAGDARAAPANAQAVAAANARELAGIQTDVTGALASLIKTGAVHVQRQGDAVQVQISADILFASGVAEPAPTAVPVLQRLAEALQPWPNAVRVEGHTDDVPISSGLFRSNWELSGARAGSVVRLFAERGIDPLRLEVVGFGQYRPMQANNTAAGRNANRRVVILILGSNRAGEAPAG
jgi:chemotaxis protein MotB